MPRSSNWPILSGRRLVARKEAIYSPYIVWQRGRLTKSCLFVKQKKRGADSAPLLASHISRFRLISQNCSNPPGVVQVSVFANHFHISTLVNRTSNGRIYHIFYLHQLLVA